jgi:hypothetical protein
MITAVLLAGDNALHTPTQASSMAESVQSEILRAIRVSFPIKGSNRTKIGRAAVL